MTPNSYTALLMEMMKMTEPAAAAPPTPTVGRIVHYTQYDSPNVPAIITRVRAGGSTVVDLQVFHFNRGCELATSVEQGDGCQAGTWSWPPRG